MQNKEVIRRTISRHFLKKGRYDLSAGGNSDIYLNIKEAYGFPEIFSDIVHEIDSDLSRLFPKQNEAPSVIAGKGVGGQNLATLLTHISNIIGLKSIIIRDKPRIHGMLSLTEGYSISPSDRILIVDDVLTTGNSIKEAAELLNDHLEKKYRNIKDMSKANIIGAYVIVKRKEPEVELDFPVHHLFTLDDLVKKENAKK